MNALGWAYVWLACAFVWGVLGFVLAIGLPRGRTGILVGWVFIGMTTLIAVLGLLPH